MYVKKKKKKKKKLVSVSLNELFFLRSIQAMITNLIMRLIIKHKDNNNNSK